MENNKIIIIGNALSSIDKDLFIEYLQHIFDIDKWQLEAIEDIKRVVKKYETHRDIAIPIK